MKNFFGRTREKKHFSLNQKSLQIGDTHMSTDSNKPSVEANRTYLCTIDSVLPGQSKAGTNKVTFSFIVTAGDAKGAILREDFYLTTKSQWKIKNLLDAVGMKKLGDRDPASLMNAFSGKQLLIRTKEEAARTADDGTEYDARVRAGAFINAGSQPEAPASASSNDDGNVPF